MNQARQDLFGLQHPIQLKDKLKLPAFAKQVWTKCRITYSEHIEQIEYEAYTLRLVHNLQLVEDNTIGYHYKFKDRSTLNQLFAQRGAADNILIVKQGYITDSYYANVVFENASGYFTPNTPLLKGIQRQYLLATKQIQEVAIRVEDIKNYKRVHLINAFLGLGDCVVDIDTVYK